MTTSVVLALFIALTASSLVAAEVVDTFDECSDSGACCIVSTEFSAGAQCQSAYDAATNAFTSDVNIGCFNSGPCTSCVERFQENSFCGCKAGYTLLVDPSFQPPQFAGFVIQQSNLGKSVCGPCASGTYKAQGDSSCEQCLDNSGYGLDGAVTLAGATSFQDCGCPDGTEFRFKDTNVNDNFCKGVNQESNLDNGNGGFTGCLAECAQCQDGFYSTFNPNDPRAACVQCPNGMYPLLVSVNISYNYLSLSLSLSLLLCLSD